MDTIRWEIVRKFQKCYNLYNLMKFDLNLLAKNEKKIGKTVFLAQCQNNFKIGKTDFRFVISGSDYPIIPSFSQIGETFGDFAA